VDLTDQFVEVKQVRPVDFVVLTVSFFEIVVVFLKMLMDHVKHNFKQVMVYAVHNDKLFSSYSGFLCEIKIFSLKSIL
jgi:hypothetical protein